MPKFIIALKNKKLKTYVTISWLIIALNFVSLVYAGFTHVSNLSDITFYAAGLLLAIFAFRLFSKNEAVENDCIILSFSLTIIAWLVLKFFLVAALVFVLFLIQDITRRRLFVLVYDDRIIYPSFPKKTLVWKDMNNAILKDGFLMIDLKNDKVFQDEIDSPTSEMEFNEFCEMKLKNVNNQ